jgi:hypothetical protein
MQNSENPPICAMPGCGNPVSKTLHGKWRVHCSNSCRGKHNSLIGETARRATNKLRYGDEHPTRTAATQARRRANSLERHGVEHQMHLPSTKQRVQQTCLDRYGVTNPSKSDEIKQRKVETSRKNYGVDHPSQSAEYQAACRAHSLATRGYAHHSQTTSYKEKYAATCIKTFGCANPAQSEEVKQRIKATWIEKYGVKAAHPKRAGITEYALDCLSDIDWLEEHKHTSSVALGSQLGVYYGTVIDAYRAAGIERECIRSAGELELLDYIKSIYQGVVIANDRSVIAPKELDIYLPELNLAFEFNGVYWHSTANGTGNDYHYLKTQACTNAGVRLVHVFENQWLDNNDLIRTRIAELVGANQLIDASECEVTLLDRADEFLQQYHITGNTPHDTAIQLLHNGAVVSCLAVKQTPTGWEIVGFCNSAGVTVESAFEILFKKFVSEIAPEKVTAVCNLYYGNGLAFQRQGFTKMSYAEPKIIEDIKQLYSFDVFDCGTEVYVWHP